MRTVNQATQNAWSEISYTSTRFYIPQLSSDVPNAKISSSRLHEAISDTDNLMFVGCISSELDLKINDFDTDIHLDGIRVFVNKTGGTESKVYEGKIYTAEYDGGTNSMDVVAYDDLYRVFNKDMTDWYNSLDFTSLNQKNYRDAFFLECGLTVVETTLPFDSMPIRKTIGGETILGRDLIKPLCEANVRLGRINWDGKFEFTDIVSNTNNRTVDIEEVSSMEKAKYITAPIDKVIIRTDEEDIGAVAGTGSNAYIIEGNMYFLGMNAAELQSIANTIYGILNGFQFQPASSEQMYNFIYELGDKITVPDGFGNNVQTILLERTTDFQREEISAKGLKKYSEAASYTNTNLVALLGKTNRLHRDIEETRSTITDVAAGLHSEITQTAEGLEIEIQNLQSQIDGEIEYFERSGTPTLTNYPAWDFTSAFKCDGTKRCADIYNTDMTEVAQGETGQYPHFYYSEQDYQDHLRDLVFDTANVVSYRFNKQTDGNITTWFWQEVADGEMGYVLQQISELKVTAEALQSDMTSVEATVSSQGLQIQTNTSNITQTSNRITTEVSRATAAEGNLSSRIDQTATDISAKVDNERNNTSFGWHLKSDKFELKSNNNVVFRCNSAGIYINGNGTFTGTIESTNARITGGSVDINASSEFSTTLRTHYGSSIYSYMTPSSFYQKNGSFYAELSAVGGLRVNNSYGSGYFDGYTMSTTAAKADRLDVSTISAKTTYGSINVSSDINIDQNAVFAAGKDVQFKGRIGFFGHTAVSRSTVTGSTDSAKLSSLLTVLRGYGLIG